MQSPKEREQTSAGTETRHGGALEKVTSHKKIAKKGPEAYSEEVERIRWKEIQEENEKRITERNSVGMFLALADDECHELVPGSHSRWRTRLNTMCYSQNP